VAHVAVGQDDGVTTVDRGTLRPRHVRVVMVGNRRWARLAGLASPSEGHRRGADHIEDLLGRCESCDIDHVSIYVTLEQHTRARAGGER